MRRSSISLAVFALILCGRTLGQTAWPQGEYSAPLATPAAYAQNAVSPIYGAQPSAGGRVVPVQYTAEQLPGSPALPSAEPVPSGLPSPETPTAQQALPQTETPQAETPQTEMLQAMPETENYAEGEISEVFEEQPPMGACNPYGVGPCCALCGGGKCCPKEWYVDQRIRMMTHPRPRSVIFSSWHDTRTYPTTSGDVTVDVYDTAISTRTMPFSLSASYEIILGRYLGLDTNNRNHYLEFNFYGTNRWSDGIGVIATKDEYSSLSATQWGVYGNINDGRNDVAGFNRADRQWAEYDASLNNFEVNLRMVPRSRADRLVLHQNGKWRRECQPGVFCSWLAGMRLFTLDENFDFHSSSTIDYFSTDDTSNPYESNTATGRYRVKTNNGLLGLQAGPEWTLRNCRTEIGMGVRGAAYINFAEQQTWINVEGAAGDEFSNKEDIDLYRSLSRNGAAASIQFDFNASYKVRPNFIIKASYELLFMSGLALAPEQVNMALDESLTINDGGSMLFQSGRLGFEYNW